MCLCKCCESVAREHNGKVEHLLYLVSDWQGQPRRSHTASVDNVKTWTGLPVEESIRMTEDGKSTSMVWPTLGSRTAPYMMSCCVRPSVHLSVHPSQVGIVSKQLDESSWFLARGFLPPIPHCVSRKFEYLQPSVLSRCWLGGRKGIRPVKT